MKKLFENKKLKFLLIMIISVLMSLIFVFSSLRIRSFFNFIMRIAPWKEDELIIFLSDAEITLFYTFIALIVSIITFIAYYESARLKVENNIKLKNMENENNIMLKSVNIKYEIFKHNRNNYERFLRNYAQLKAKPNKNNINEFRNSFFTIYPILSDESQNSLFNFKKQLLRKDFTIQDINEQSIIIIEKHFKEINEDYLGNLM